MQICRLAWRAQNAAKEGGPPKSPEGYCCCSGDGLPLADNEASHPQEAPCMHAEHGWMADLQARQAKVHLQTRVIWHRVLEAGQHDCSSQGFTLNVVQRRSPVRNKSWQAVTTADRDRRTMPAPDTVPATVPPQAAVSAAPADVPQATSARVLYVSDVLRAKPPSVMMRRCLGLSPTVPCTAQPPEAQSWGLRFRRPSQHLTTTAAHHICKCCLWVLTSQQSTFPEVPSFAFLLQPCPLLPLPLFLGSLCTVTQRLRLEHAGQAAVPGEAFSRGGTTAWWFVASPTTDRRRLCGPLHSKGSPPSKPCLHVIHRKALELQSWLLSVSFTCLADHTHVAKPLLACHQQGAPEEHT